MLHILLLIWNWDETYRSLNITTSELMSSGGPPDQECTRRSRPESCSERRPPHVSARSSVCVEVFISLLWNTIVSWESSVPQTATLFKLESFVVRSRSVSLSRFVFSPASSKSRSILKYHNALGSLELLNTNMLDYTTLLPLPLQYLSDCKQTKLSACQHTERTEYYC